MRCKHSSSYWTAHATKRLKCINSSIRVTQTIQVLLIVATTVWALAHHDPVVQSALHRTAVPQVKHKHTAHSSDVQDVTRSNRAVTDPY